MARMCRSGYVDVLAGASSGGQVARRGAEHLGALRTVANLHAVEVPRAQRTTSVRWVPLASIRWATTGVGIEAHAVQVAHVTLLTLIYFDNAITTAGWPFPRLSATRTPILDLRVSACDRLRTQVLGVTDTWVVHTGFVPLQHLDIARIARQCIITMPTLGQHAQCGATVVSRISEVRWGIALAVCWAGPGVA